MDTIMDGVMTKLLSTRSFDQASLAPIFSNEVIASKASNNNPLGFAEFYLHKKILAASSSALTTRKRE